MHSCLSTYYFITSAWSTWLATRSLVTYQPITPARAYLRLVVIIQDDCLPSYCPFHMFLGFQALRFRLSRLRTSSLAITRSAAAPTPSAPPIPTRASPGASRKVFMLQYFTSVWLSWRQPRPAWLLIHNRSNFNFSTVLWLSSSRYAYQA